MKIVKISGAGNDFVVIGPDEAAILGDGLVAWTRRVCRRGLSVGADGVQVTTTGTAPPAPSGGTVTAPTSSPGSPSATWSIAPNAPPAEVINMISPPLISDRSTS